MKSFGYLTRVKFWCGTNPISLTIWCHILNCYAILDWSFWCIEVCRYKFAIVILTTSNWVVPIFISTTGCSVFPFWQLFNMGISMALNIILVPSRWLCYSICLCCTMNDGEYKNKNFTTTRLNYILIPIVCLSWRIFRVEGNSGKSYSNHCNICSYKVYPSMTTVLHTISRGFSMWSMEVTKIDSL